MTWHPEILTRRQQRVFSELAQCLAERGFYLAGGTAVALHLGHRRSIDLDWFASEFPDPVHLADDLRARGIHFVTEEVAPGTLHGTVGGIQVTLLRYRYPMLAKLRSWPGGGCIASRADLAAMKLSAVAQRGSKKDFVDIYTLAKRTKSLNQMLEWYRQKFATKDIAHLLRSLTYFDNADRERLPRMLWKVDWRTIKDAIRRWVKQAVD